MSMVTIRIPTPFFERILTDDGVIRFLTVYRGSNDVRALGNLQTELSDGDILSIIRAVAGGHA